MLRGKQKKKKNVESVKGGKGQAEMPRRCICGRILSARSYICAFECRKNRGRNLTRFVMCLYIYAHKTAHRAIPRHVASGEWAIRRDNGPVQYVRSFLSLSLCVCFCVLLVDQYCARLCPTASFNRSPLLFLGEGAFPLSSPQASFRPLTFLWESKAKGEDERKKWHHWRCLGGKRKCGFTSYLRGFGLPHCCGEKRRKNDFLGIFKAALVDRELVNNIIEYFCSIALTFNRCIFPQLRMRIRRQAISATVERLRYAVTLRCSWHTQARSR